MCAEKFPLVLMGGRAEGLVCADPGASTPSALAEISLSFFLSASLTFLPKFVGGQKNLGLNIFWGSTNFGGQHFWGLNIFCWSTFWGGNIF